MHRSGRFLVSYQRSAPASTSCPAGTGIECIEDVPQPEIPEQVFVAGWPVVGSVPRPEGGRSDIIVLGLFLGIAEHLVGLINFLELLF